MVKTYPCLCFAGQRIGPGNEHNKAQCLPISRDSDVTTFLIAGPGRMIILLIKIEGHRPPDNNEVSCVLPFYVLRSVAASPLPSFARYNVVIMFSIMITSEARKLRIIYRSL